MAKRNKKRRQKWGSGEKQKDSIDMQVSTIPIVQANIMKISLPLDVIQEVNTHIDNKINKEDYAHRLAGEIVSGEQTKLDAEHEDLSKLKMAFIRGTEEYLIQWMQNSLNGRMAYKQNREGLFTKSPSLEINDMWYNIYYKGDYNPLHNHGTESRMGLSSFLFLKVPESLQEEKQEGFQAGGTHGMNDGLTYFNCGQSTGHDIYDLVCTNMLAVRPTVGDLWLFPKWLEHGVYPFRGEGERRTLAANVNIWFDKE